MQQLNWVVSDKSAILAKLRSESGMFAALDQSGGSTPSALARYGIAASAYSGEEEMFDLIHRMRLRIMSAPRFDGDRILATILFTRTMMANLDGQSVPEYLWKRKRIASFLKVDQGLEDSVDGAQLMRPIPDLQRTLAAAREAGVVGTKMRSLIHESTRNQIFKAVAQQWALAEEILSHDLIPIVEIETSTKLTDLTRRSQELHLREALCDALSKSDAKMRVMFKLTLPVTPNFYKEFMSDAKVIRILALSGGFSRDHACTRLLQNPGMIASFSRALTQDLRAEMSNELFNRTLDDAIREIVEATALQDSFNPPRKEL